MSRQALGTLPDVLSAEQLAELLDCTPETVEDRTRARLLPAVKVGRSWRYPREAVLQVLTREALKHVEPAPVPVPAPAPTYGPVLPAAPLALVPTGTRRRRAPQVGPAPLPDPPASGNTKRRPAAC